MFNNQTNRQAMLNQSNLEIWFEKQKEQSEYERYNSRSLKFNPLPNGDLEHRFKWIDHKNQEQIDVYTIQTYGKSDMFGYKFEVFLDGKSQEKFYTLANAKRYIVKWVEETMDDLGME